MGAKNKREFGESEAQAIGLTRSEVAKRWGVSTMVVRTMEKEGKLHPVITTHRGQEGVRLFNPKEIDSFLPSFSRAKPASADEVEARVIGLLEQGKELSEIVLKLNGAASIKRIREIHAEWKTGLDDGLMAKETAEFDKLMASILTGGKRR